MPNRLATETSPYLRQHADNPVDWYPWGDEAFAAARELDRPVLLSVGYSSCHWCHVMAEESFADPATAEVMNANFVSVKVDREERPDVDAIYMEATQAMTGHGGWPMTAFLTPDGAPFFCGTYFPPEPRGAQPSFRQLLDAVHEAWTGRRDELLEQAARLTEAVATDPAVPAPTGGRGGATVLEESTRWLLVDFDQRWGGFGAAPKFPQAMSIEALLRDHVRTGSAPALAVAVASLDAMAAGGIHDHLGGGFARYSVDERWLVPHFEKMLYDNALLARAYLHAHQVTGDERHARVATATIDYVLRDLSRPGGGHHSAEDADAAPWELPDGPHEEGAFYVWTPAEVADALGAVGLAEHAEALCGWYGITDAGNFEGASIPNRLADRTGTPLPASLVPARDALLAARAERPRPGLDDKVLTEWNGLFLAALAEAGAALDRPDYLAAAEATATFLCERLRRADGRWLRSWQSALDDGRGGARHLAYAADHGALVDGFLCLYQATGRLRWLHEARSTADALLELFVDGPDDDHPGTVHTTGADAEALLTRPREVVDNATPSGASQAAVGCLRLEALTGERRYGDAARSILARLEPLVDRRALAFGHLLWAVQLATAGVREVVVTGERPDLVTEVQRRFLPDAVLAWGERDDGPLWAGREETGADGRAYVCVDHACRAPVDTVAALAAEL